MDNNNSTNFDWRDLVPKGRSGIIAIIIVAVAAFSLGALFFGGDGNNTGAEKDAHEHAEASSQSSFWTCSMHPQIQLPKPGKCPICFMDLIPVQSGDSEDLGPRQIRMSQSARELARIETTPVIRAFAEREIRMVGKLNYDESRLAYITAWVPGRLDRLFVDYTGARVAAGEHLVQMYSPELISAQEEFLQAGKAVKALQNSSSEMLRSTAQETLRSSREKLRLFGLTEAQIDSIEQSGKYSDQLTINAPIGGVVVHKEAREGMYVSTGTRIYTIADLSHLWVMLEAYESDLPWLRYGQRITFTSPSFPGEEFDAIITFIEPTVNPKTRTVDVRAIVRNNDGRLKPDMYVSGIVKSQLDNAGNVIAPSLANKWICSMHPEIIKNHPGTCDICDMPLVRAETLGFSAGVAEGGEAPLLIPASAPLITGKRAVVYVEIPDDEGPLFEGREIELGPRAGDYYIVKAGLVEGEMVVTNGAFKVDSELQIRAKPSMMSPEDFETQPAGKESQKTAVSGTAVKEVQASTEAIAQLTPLYTAYFELQMALADDNLDNAKKAFGTVKQKTAEVDMGKFKGEAHTRWMKLSDTLTKAVTRGEGAQSIEDARDAFYHTSLAVIELHDSFGHADGKDFFLTFCPMARDNAGAYWLQNVDTVYNSFYGAMMLRCGEIKKPLHAISKESE